MSQGYYWRIGTGTGLQDAMTYILLGHSTCLYNKLSGEWFLVSDVPPCPSRLRRKTTQILAPMDRGLWLRCTRPWGRWVALADRMRLRAPIRWLSEWTMERYARKSMQIEMEPGKPGEITSWQGDEHGGDRR